MNMITYKRGGGLILGTFVHTYDLVDQMRLLCWKVLVKLQMRNLKTLKHGIPITDFFFQCSDVFDFFLFYLEPTSDQDRHHLLR